MKTDMEKWNNYKLVYTEPKHYGETKEKRLEARSYQNARNLARWWFRSEHGYSIDACENWDLYKCNENWEKTRK